MITQRDLDIAQVEAKLKTDKLFEEWRKSYLGRRAEVQDGGRAGRGNNQEILGVSEDSEAPDTNVYSEAS